MNRFVRLAQLLSALVIAPLAALGCGETAAVPAADTSGTVIVDGARAFSVTYDSPACDQDWPCGAVRRFDRATGVSTVVVRVPGLADLLASDDEYVYVVSKTGELHNEGGPSDDTNLVTTLERAPKSGGAVAVIATLPHAIVDGLVVRGGNAYFIMRSTTAKAISLCSVPTGGGAIVYLATLDASVTRVIADDDFVYWAERHDDGNSRFDIRKAPLAGAGAPTLVASGAWWIEDMAVDATTLYVTNHGPPASSGVDSTQGAVVAYPLRGGTPRTVASALTGVGAIAVDDSRVIWATWETAAPTPGSPKGHVHAVGKSGGAESSVIASFDAASIAADGAGLCVSALFSPQLVCLGK